MSEKFSSLTVVMGKDISEAEVELLIASIGQFRGVIDVTAQPVSLNEYIAYQRARRELTDRLFDVLHHEHMR